MSIISFDVFWVSISFQVFVIAIGIIQSLKIATYAQSNTHLQELDHLKSNFFANISHEIRTPLTLILSPVESVLQGDYGKKIDRKFFENLQRNAIRLLKLINNLLDFSKIEAGRMGLKVQESDIVHFIKTYVGSVHSAADSKGIALNFVSVSDEVLLYFDKEKMDKIIMNLFSNALKFTDKGGAIKIVVKDTEKDCIIEFTDTGVGVPADKLTSIFDRFSQADSSSTRKFEGTGIGLALAKELVELHGGTISVKSRYIDDNTNDHGTTFTVIIPRGKDHLSANENVEYLESEELDEAVTDHRFAGMREMTELRTSGANESADSNPRLSGAPPLPGKVHLITLLIVEDNPDMRNFLTFLLQDHYTVHTAENGEEGLRKARELHPDLIVSDVMMPVMNGYEMTQKIKEDEELKRTPVLMLTAKAEIANKIEGLEYGADDYLTKPFNSKELLTRIKSLLKINMLQRELLDLNQNLEIKVREQLNTIMKGDELKRYLPPQLVDSIVKGEKHVTFENERRKLTIFFSDIKGFTETTDSMEAEELSLLLNEYLTEMTKIAHQHGGTIDKFIGDAIMIFFGAPESTTEKDQALRCVKMAIEMQNKMTDLKQKWFNSGIEYPLEIRIGINTGTATVGNFGAEDRLSYTAIGGQVNLASRLEGLCNPGGILISHSTWANVEEKIPCKVRGKVKVKGINREILVYDVELK
jgi:adenylate cyclase